MQLFNHLVGAGEQSGRHGEPNVLCGRAVTSAATVYLISAEQDVCRIDGRAVHECDDLVWAAKAGVDLPLIGHADLGEGGPLSLIHI